MAIGLAALAAAGGEVDAQTINPSRPTGPTRPPITPGHPTATVPEVPAQSPEPGKSAGEQNPPGVPGDGAVVPKAPPGTISEKLSKGKGVLAPPKGIDPSLAVKPPVKDPGTMIVIPPPGPPGNPEVVRPK